MSLPRYPLLHQQPLFTEGMFNKILRAENPPAYEAEPLPQTTKVNEELLRMPAFPQASRKLMDQYAEAFEKVLTHAKAVAASR